jgi:hypothetical protein
MDEKVKVFLTPEDIEKFKLFNKHYDLFTVMEQQGIFDIQFGKCTLNIAGGMLQNVVKESVVWRR